MRVLLLSWELEQEVREHSRSRGVVRAVLGVYAAHAPYDTRLGFCGVALITHEAQCHPTSVSRARTVLEELGELLLIDGHRRGGWREPPVYLVLPELASAEQLERARTHGSDLAKSGGRGMASGQRGDGISLNRKRPNGGISLAKSGGNKERNKREQEAELSTDELWRLLAT